MTTLPHQVAPLMTVAESLLPVLREHGDWMETNRTQHAEVLEAVQGAGLFDLRRPRHVGGVMPSYREILDAVSTLAQGDGSTAWVVTVNTITSWMAAHLPELAVEEVFAEPGAQICGTLSPGGALEQTTDGSAYILNGSWRFISGARSSVWQVVIAVMPSPDGEGIMPAIAAVPMADLGIVDDWYTTGLRATGSVTTTAQEVLVPAHRVLPLPTVLEGQAASPRVSGTPAFGSPLVSTASGLSAAVAPGLATAALDMFIARATERGITYTSYERQDQAPVTHLQVGEAALLADESAHHARVIADQLDDFNGDHSAWTIADRVAARGRLGRSAEQALRAVRLLGDASGGSSIYLNSPIQRVVRDLQAMSEHALIVPATNRELHGRVLCDLEPTTQYI